MPAASKKKKLIGGYSLKQLIQAGASFLFFVAVLILGANLISTEHARDKITNAGVYGPLVLILLKAATNIIAPLGGNPIYLSAAPLFGFTLGCIYLLVGDIIGYTVSFFLSRLIGRRVVKLFFSEDQVKRLDGMLQDVSRWKSVLLLAGLFFSFPDFASYGAGLTPISFWRFILVITPIVIVKILLLMVLGQKFITNQTSFLIVVGVTTVLPVVVVGIRGLLKSK